MCGIFGVATRRAGSFTDESALRRMMATLRHRGPDDEGLYRDPLMSMGMTRLSIIDVAGGHQPLSNEDGSLWIVFNGEIYNFRELRARLESQGVRFRTASDTEVILLLYEAEGAGCTRHLNGMFAFCIWDRRTSRVFLARDRFGIKPLYYTQLGEDLVFASEIKALLQFPGVAREIDPGALDAYLTFEYVPGTQSIFRGIRKLPPAHSLIYADGRTHIEPYWSLPVEEHLQFDDEVEAGEALLEKLTAAVRRRLMSEVPLGVHLSGGIDSSSIVAIASRENGRTIKTFSMGFEEDSFDESAYARQVAESYQTDHHHRTFSSSDVLGSLPKIAAMVDEPFADGSLFPTLALSQFSKEQVTVALSGEGGDEVLAGYPTYQAHRIAAFYRRLPETLRRRLIERPIASLPASFRNFSLDFVAKKFVSGASIADPIERHVRWMGAFCDLDKAELYTDSFRAALDATPEPHCDLPVAVDTDELSQLQRFDLDTYLRDGLLVKLDRSGMINSQELRVPFLDHELVEFLFRLPPSLRLRGLRSKHILKQAMKGKLPKAVIARKKKGFGMPVAAWIQGPLREILLDTLSETRIRRAGIFRYAYVDNLLRDHFAGRTDNRKKIWTLFMFQLWEEHTQRGSQSVP